MPKAAQKLTKAKLEALRRDVGNDPTFSKYIADSGQPGLYVQARRGRVRFIFEYRPAAGPTRRRRMQIDDFGAITLDQAREIAQGHRGTVAAGGDPQEERLELRRQSTTVADAVELYLADLEKRAEGGAKRGKRSGYASASRLLRRNVLPKLGEQRIREVNVEHVRVLHRGMSSTPVEANRTLTALSAVFSFADLEGKIPAGHNPCRHVTRFEETGERRALTPEELTALGLAMRNAEGSVNPSVLLALRVLALTGFRRAELLGHMSKNRRSAKEGLRWSDVDLDQGTIRLRDTKTGAQTRVIGHAAVELLKSVRRSTAEPADPVCPGKNPRSPLVGIDRPRRQLYEAAGLHGVDLHSLRHSFASISAHVYNGRYAAFVGPLLGHGYTKRGITDRYIHADPEAMRPAADAIAAKIATYLGLGEPAKVLEFSRKGQKQ